METKKILDKISKCLRLSESGNPHEAAMALRQAQGLMKKYGICEDQVLAANVSEAVKSVDAASSPPFWALALSNLVADAFACQAFVARRTKQAPQFHFIGVGSLPVVGAYTFAVLFRQLKRARHDYIRSLEQPRAEKTRRGNVFAQAWLYRVARTVSSFTQSEEGKQAMQAYIREHYGEMGHISRAPTPPQPNTDYDAVLSGMRAADGVSLFRPMHQKDETPQLEMEPA